MFIGYLDPQGLVLLSNMDSPKSRNQFLRPTARIPVVSGLVVNTRFLRTYVVCPALASCKPITKGPCSYMVYI